jgi:hypothetical protein
VKTAFLCLPQPGPPPEIAAQVTAAAAAFDKQTGQEQAASRAAVPICKSCHGQFDSYGLVLEYYDAVASYRTTYDYLNGTAIDGTTTLPSVVGGATVHNAVEFAQTLATSPTFINCFTKSMLQYAMTDLSADVQLPLAPSQSGCAAADVVQKFQSGSSQTFASLVNVVAQSPAFAIRKPAP